MVEPPSAIYVQWCGSVWDMGELACGGELRTGVVIVGGWSRDSSGLTRPRLWDAVRRESLRGRRKEKTDLREARRMAATGGDPTLVCREGQPENIFRGRDPKKKQRRLFRPGSNHSGCFIAGTLHDTAREFGTGVPSEDDDAFRKVAVRKENNIKWQDHPEVLSITVMAIFGLWVISLFYPLFAPG